MALSLIIMGMLVLVVFGFVLEPILRARRDNPILAIVSIPESVSLNTAMEAEPASIETDTADDRAAASNQAVTKPGHAEGSS